MATSPLANLMPKSDFRMEVEYLLWLVLYNKMNSMTNRYKRREFTLVDSRRCKSLGNDVRAFSSKKA